MACQLGWFAKADSKTIVKGIAVRYSTGGPEDYGTAHQRTG